MLNSNEIERKKGNVEIKGVTKIYRGTHGSDVEALREINLEVKHNEFVSLIGSSGCGKTTMLKLVGDLIEPTKGSILVDGCPTRECRQRREFGFVFQFPELLPWRTVFENCCLPLEVIGRGNDRTSKERIIELLNLVGLFEFRNFHPIELSGGMQQRVSIVRALSYDPKILLMDEPFGALDALTRDRMNLELLKIWQREKKTVLFVTHSIGEAVFLSDYVVVLTRRPGRIKEIVQVNLTRPRSAKTRDNPHYFEYVRKLRRILQAD